MQRRNFIKRLGYGAAGLWLAPQMLSSCKKEQFEELDPSQTNENQLIGASDRAKTVIIVGAGAAGMYAASWLRTKGVTVKILESSERRGGRVRTLENFADFKIEAGAEIIHGSNSALYQWAVQQGAQFVNYAPMNYYRLDGLLKNETQIQNDPDMIAAWNFVENATDYSGTDKTVAQRITEINLPARVRHIPNADLGNDWGTDNGQLSIKGITQESNAWTAGDNDYMMKNRSFAQILDTQFANILSDIQYNKKAVRIEYPTGGAKPKVKDQTGVWHEADAVLLTVPLSILKNNGIEFFPVLPAWKTTAIQNIGMGNGMKIILKFSQRFWANNLGFLTSDQLGHVAWYTSKQRGNSHVLTFFVMGSRAATLSAQGAGAVTTVVNELNGLFGSNVASNALLASHIEDWSANPHIGGSYSYPIVNGGGLNARRDLAKKLNNKLFFAGEATHFAGHNSTLHGALETGLRAAKEIWAVI